MTTIIIDCGNKKVYADTRATEQLVYKSVKREYSEVKKVFEIDEYVITGTGNYESLLNFRQMYKDKGSIPTPTGIITVYVVQDKGKTLQVDTYESEKYFDWLTLKHKYKYTVSTTNYTAGFVVDGSGIEYAQGALAAGASPRAAIRAAAACHSGTGPTVDCVDVPTILEEDTTSKDEPLITQVMEENKHER